VARAAASCAAALAATLKKSKQHSATAGHWRCCPSSTALQQRTSKAPTSSEPRPHSSSLLLPPLYWLSPAPGLLPAAQTSPRLLALPTWLLLSAAFLLRR
jgi:hypothetical protein